MTAPAVTCNGWGSPNIPPPRPVTNPHPPASRWCTSLAGPSHPRCFVHSRSIMSALTSSYLLTVARSAASSHSPCFRVLDLGRQWCWPGWPVGVASWVSLWCLGSSEEVGVHGPAGLGAGGGSCGAGLLECVVEWSGDESFGVGGEVHSPPQVPAAGEVSAGEVRVEQDDEVVVSGRDVVGESPAGGDQHRPADLVEHDAVSGCQHRGGADAGDHGVGAAG